MIPALVVPDERSWAAWGVDVSDLGYRPAASATEAQELLAPAHVPTELAEAIAGAWSQMGPRRRLRALGDPLPDGVPLVRALQNDESEGGGNQHEHAHGEGHDDMMAVTGEPSADGLVMEDVEFTLGPLAPQLPAGLVAELALDGDVVSDCALRPVLRARAVVPDPTVPSSWRAAIGRGPTAVLAVERERVTSHASWFTVLGRLLGWEELSRTARACRSDDHPTAVEAAARLERLTSGRRFAARMDGLATVTKDEAGRREAEGPVARACGLAVDARQDDPAYARLDFEPVIEEAGDARARARVRARELSAALVLAEVAPERAAAPAPAVEGPRGPLRVMPAGPGEPSRPEAPGTAAALALAARAAVGLEWSDAVLAIASFDLSGWAVAG